LLVFQYKGMKNILLLKGQSQYNVLRYFIDQLSVAFQHIGHTVTIIDLVEISSVQDLQQKMLFVPDLVISYNGMGTDINIFKSIPFITHYVDHPLYHVERIQNHSSSTLCGFVDKRHGTFVDNYIRKDLRHFFLPHGACLFEDTSIQAKDHSKLDPELFEYDIFFTGSLWDLPVLEEKINTFNSAGRKITWDLINQQLSTTHSLNIDERLAFIEKKSPSYFKGGSLQEVLPYLYYADTYSRSARRLHYIDLLVKESFKILLVGSMWQKQSYGPLVTIKESLDFYEALQEMHRAQFTLSILPCISGIHERILTAMAARIPVISDTSESLVEEFDDEKDIIYFSGRSIGSLRDKMESYNIEEIVENAYQKVMKKHLWVHRAQTIMDQV